MSVKLLTTHQFLNATETAVFARDAQCSRISEEFFESQRREALSVAQSRTGKAVMLESDFWNMDGPERDAYMGALVTTVAERDALRSLSVEGEWRDRPHSSRKVFDQRRARGEIVLNPIRAARFSAREEPAVVPLDGAQVLPYARTNRLMQGLGYDPSVPGCSGTNTRYMPLFPEIRFHWTSLDMRNAGIEIPTAQYTVRRQFQSESNLLLFANEVVFSCMDAFEVDSGLVTEARAAANSGTYDILTELAELPETVKYLYAIVKEIITLFRGTRKKVRDLSKLRHGETEAAHAARLADLVSGLWLEFRYAVMPLCYSANDALELLAVDASRYLTFRHGESSQITVRHFGEDYQVQTIDRCYIKRRYGANTGTYDHLKIQVAATAWELVPLSFIVDWAFNVGDYLSSFTVPSAVSQEAAQYSWQVKGQVSILTPSGSTVSVDLELYEARLISPGAHIGLNSDVFINLKRTLDALALSWGIFRSKGRR